MKKLFIFRQSRHFDFDAVICKLLFPICTLTWRVNIYASHQGKSLNRRKESTGLDFSVVTLLYCQKYPVLLLLLSKRL